MVLLAYCDGGERRGYLAFQQSEDGCAVALGGMTPEELGFAESTAADPVTVVTTDNGERVLKGWIHPDQLAELHGTDSNVEVVY